MQLLTRMSRSRWPASMRAVTAAEYLDLGTDAFRALNIPCIQHTERGDRYWLKEDLDAYLEQRRRASVKSPRA